MHVKDQMEGDGKGMLVKYSVQVLVRFWGCETGVVSSCAVL